MLLADKTQRLAFQTQFKELVLVPKHKPQGSVLNLLDLERVLDLDLEQAQAQVVMVDSNRLLDQGSERWELGRHNLLDSSKAHNPESLIQTLFLVVLRSLQESLGIANH